ncbi:MAG: protein-glutamate O-methyltransferase CheR [Rickettsiales bacterium]
MTASSQNFAYLADAVVGKSGIVLSKDKMYLLESRLTPVAERYGCVDVDMLVNRLRDTRSPYLLSDIVDAMTTNESLFFRDSRPFDALAKTVAPAALKNRSGSEPLRLWSAACSLGQEPYSMAISLMEAGYARKFAIYATDICRDVLARAKEGRFSQFEAQRGMSIQLLLKYFTQEGNFWRVKDEVKHYVTFAEGNLMEPLRGQQPFDAAFCRNVLIYFDAQGKEKALSHVRAALRPGGYMFLGGPESLIGLACADKFTREDVGYPAYRMKQ